MNKTVALGIASTVSVVAIVSSGCRSQKQETTAREAAEDRKLEEVGAAGARGDLDPSTKDGYLEAVRRDIDAAEAQAQQIRKDLASNPDARERVRTALEMAKAQLDMAKDKLEDIEEAPGDAWEVMRTDADVAVDTARAALDEAEEALRS